MESALRTLAVIMPMLSRNAILNHQSKKGYACDVAQGPLDNAKKRLKRITYPIWYLVDY